MSLGAVSRRAVSIARAWVFGLLVVAAVLACGKKDATTVRVGYQKYGMLLVLKQRGTLEKALAPSNVKVEWSEFPSGPPMMEAFHGGSIDFGVAGEAPPVFAQANGVPLAYVACDPPAPRAEAILVHRASPIAHVADLRGKTVALNRGSNVHYLLAAALAEAGVAYKDVNVVFLPPSDGRAAFDSGKVDAWVIWDPFLSAALAATDARVLRDGTGVASNVGYYFASPPFAKAHPEIVTAIAGAIKEVDAFVAQHPGDTASLLATSLGMPAAAIEDSLHRSTFDIRAIAPEVALGQQRVADTFFDLGLIPQRIRVADDLASIASPP